MAQPKANDRILYQGHITLVHRPYLGKDYDVVISKNAAVMLYIDEKDQVYFAKQFRPAIDQESLGLPAETLDKSGLTPLEVMLEGLEEECGIKIKANQVISLGDVFSSEGHDSEKVYLFIAHGKGEYVGQKLCDDEKIEVIKVPFEEVYQKVIKNEIKGAKTSYLVMYEKLRRLGIIK